MAKEAPEPEQQPTDPSAAAQAAASIDVFISYASQDAAIADAVVVALERDGVKCWIAPRDVAPGEFYAGVIVHAIDAAKVTVLILSQNASASPHVVREVERAASKRHPVISLRIDLSPLPADLEYFLNASQWLDASGGHTARAMPKLLAAVRLAVDRPATPDGATGSRTSSLPKERSRRRMSIAVGAPLAVAIGGFIAYRSWEPAHHTAAPPAVVTGATSTTAPALPAVPEKSVAVLPFVDMSEEHDQEYFSDGLSEELIDHLTQAKDLKVIARTSSFSFKGKSEDVRTIASKLGVAHLLEGSVRKSGATLRITAQLIRAADGTHLWSQIYDRSPVDIFKVQDEIAGTVARALNATLNTEIAGMQDARSVEAHNLLLQGNFLLDRSTKRDTEKAISLYNRAIEVDPSYALAWVKLASANMSQAGDGWIPITEGIARARDYLARALKIDPNLAAAHRALGWLYLSFDWNWKAAGAEFDLARKLDPNDDKAEGNIFWIDAIRHGRLQETITHRQQHILRDPLDTDELSALGFALYTAGRWNEAEMVWRKLEELNANFSSGHAWWAIAQVLAGRNTEALATVEKETDEAWRLSASPVVYWALARRHESDVALGVWTGIQNRVFPGVGAVWPPGAG